MNREWYRFETTSTGIDLAEGLKRRHNMPRYLINVVLCKWLSMIILMKGLQMNDRVHKWNYSLLLPKELPGYCHKVMQYGKSPGNFLSGYTQRPVVDVGIPGVKQSGVIIFMAFLFDTPYRLCYTVFAIKYSFRVINVLKYILTLSYPAADILKNIKTWRAVSLYEIREDAHILPLPQGFTKPYCCLYSIEISIQTIIFSKKV